jgi:hypothetical protein
MPTNIYVFRIIIISLVKKSLCSLQSQNNSLNKSKEFLFGGSNAKNKIIQYKKAQNKMIVNERINQINKGNFSLTVSFTGC